MPEALKPKFICEPNDGQWVIYEMDYRYDELKSTYGDKIKAFNDKEEAYTETDRLNNQNK